MDGKDDRGPDDRTLDAQLRAHFEAERGAIPVPAFEAAIAKAEAKAEVEAKPDRVTNVRRLRPGRMHLRAPVWAGAGALAAAVLAAVYLGTVVDTGGGTPDEFTLAALPAEVAISEAELVADLNRGTRWQAPSDRWLAAQADLDVLGLPDLSDPAADPKEMNPWM